LDDVDKKEVGREDTEKDVNVQNQAISRKKSTHWLISLGPEVITGASDDDPSGIATYSQAGAQFGFGMLWMAYLCLPLGVAID
jgi:Mn2+/Fe2+ NRAMP family transporter